MGAFIYSMAQRIFFGTRALPPLRAVILLTNQCNCHCSMCRFVASPSQKEQLTVQEVSAVLGQMPWGSIITLTGGEPTVSSDFWPILEMAVKRHKVQLLTNGTTWDGPMIARMMKAGSLAIHFSLDAPRAEIHDRIRSYSGAFDKAVATMKEIDRLRQVRRQSWPLINVNMVLLPETIPYLSEMVDFCISCNVNALSMAPDQERGALGSDSPIDLDCLREQLIKSAEAAKKGRLHLRLGNNFTMDDVGQYYSSSQERVGRRLVEDMSQFVCFTPWTTLVILSNGDVTQCNIVMGNIKKQKVSEIWNGIKMREMRRKARKGTLLTCDCLRCCFLARS